MIAYISNICMETYFIIIYVKINDKQLKTGMRTHQLIAEETWIVKTWGLGDLKWSSVKYLSVCFPVSREE